MIRPNRFNEKESQKLRDEQLPQVVPKQYDPSNVFDDVSHDKNRNPQVQILQLSDVQILKNKKVLLRPAARPPPPHTCVCMPPSPTPPISSDTGPIMTFEDPPTPKSSGTYKIRTPGKKAMMVRRAILQPGQPLLSPDRRRDRQSVTYRSKAARPIYHPIGAMQGRQKVTELRSKLCLEYDMHRLTSQGISFFGVLGGTPSGPEDM